MPNELKLSLVMAITRNVFEKSHMTTRPVLKDLYESSISLASISSSSTNGSSARLTVCSNWLSISSCGLSISSTTASFFSPFWMWADGSASALSEPLVPQDTSCQLLKA